MRFNEQFIRQVIPHAIIQGVVPFDVSFSIDSRTVQPGDIFVALQGKQCNGHTFLKEALHKGAVGAVIALEYEEMSKQLHAQDAFKQCTFIVVPNPERALISWATAWRAQFDYPVIGITGSVGKTTTKEMISQMLSIANIPFISSFDNQNTKIGGALNILRMRAHHNVAVFEMGINRRGEMSQLAHIIRPTIGMITSVGHSHMEGLGSLQDIAFEKRDIFKYFTEENIGIVNGDQPLLAQVSYPHPVIKFGLKTTNQIQARKLRMVDGCMRCMLKLYKNKYNVTLPKPHIGVVTNALATASIAHVLHIEPVMMLQAMQKPLIIAGRFERLPMKAAKGVLINDCYNASPESMKAALTAFQQIETHACKIVVLGDMLELGVNSPFWHRQIGRFFRKAPSLKRMLLVGDLVQWIEKTVPLSIQVERVSNWQEAEKRLALMMDQKEHLVLVKGSNGVGLQNLVKRYAY